LGGVGRSRHSFSGGGTCLAEGEKDYSPLEGGAEGGVGRYNNFIVYRFPP